MGKLTLQVEVDEALVQALESSGLSPRDALSAGIQARAAAELRTSQQVGRARETASDPEASRRRYHQWAEGSREYLDALRRWTEENGPFGGQWRSW